MRLWRRPRRDPFVPPAEDAGYRGPARIAVGETVLDVDVVLLDHLEPLDGRTHWYGRVRAVPEVTALKDGGATVVDLVIDGVAAEVRLAEYDAWGNVALRGVGAPPYA